MKKLMLTHFLIILLSMKISTGSNDNNDCSDDMQFKEYAYNVKLGLLRDFRLSLGYSITEQEKITVMAFILNIQEQWLYDIFKLECGHNEKAVNRQFVDPSDPIERIKLGRATGMIQFMPFTARSLGTTTMEIYHMSKFDQLDYVLEYLLFYKPPNGYKSITDLYLAVFWPRAIGKMGSYQLGGKVTRRQNSGIDRKGDNNGVITIDDVNSWINYHIS